MSTTKANNSTELGNVGEILSKSENFIEKNQKWILIGIGAVILLVLAVLGIRHSYLLPKEREAEAAIFKGENYFAANQWDLALKGDSIDFIGFEGVIDEYGSTKSGKLAKAYAGICYFHKGEFETALKYLKGFGASDKMISPAITGLIGDCYVELNKAEEGINYFEKAATKANNDLLSPIYLKKAGLAYESLGKYKQALEAYSKIQSKYPASQEAADIEKYIDKAKALVK